jgi:hypothetical protein
MNGKKTGLLSYLIKVPVLFFYITFFIVEIFFNYGTGNFPDNGLAFQKDTSVCQTSLCINKSNKGKDKEQTFHLNKRFEPKNILNSSLLVFKFPDYHLEKKVFVSKYDLFIPATDMVSHSYRGPPVGA